MMKHAKLMLSMLAIAGLLTATFVGCGEDEPPALALVSLTAAGIDLNAATSATGVPVGANLVATFNVPVDQATAATAITLTRQFDNQPFPATITVAGTEVTINPNTDFSTGTLFIVTFTNALLSAQGKGLATAVERNFTSQGTFAVPGAFAHWTFEDNPNDIIGGRTPRSGGVVAITYVDGRKPDAGKAASFNGTTSIIEFANGSQFMNNGSWAMSVWVRATPHPQHANRGQFVIGLGAFNGFQFEIFGSYNGFKLAAAYAHTNPAGPGGFSEDLWADGEGNLGWQGWTFSRDFRPVGGMSTVIRDRWAHYVFVYDAPTRLGTIYLNGERIKEQDFDNWPDNANPRFATGLRWRGVAPEVLDELALGFVHSRGGTLWDSEPWGGYDFPGASHFTGLMDDLIIYHKSLNQAEVTAMFNSGRP